MADFSGNTAVHAASKHGCVDTLELLLDPPIRAQIDSITDVDEEGSTFETSESCVVLRQLLSPFPNVNLTTADSRLTPLHLAVLSDDINTARLLLDHGASTSITNSRYLTPLETCSNEKIARLLTDRAKSQRVVLTRDKAGQTKLHRACHAGDLEQTVGFLNQGADIDMKDNAKWTPLHEASLEGHSDIVLALLRRGADFNARGFGGDTPLHDACANGHVDVVRCLIAAGADPHLQNSKNETPEDMAKEEEQGDVLLVIEKHKQSKYLYSVPAVQKLSRRTQNGKGKRVTIQPDSSGSDMSDSAGIEAEFSRIDVVSDDADPDNISHEFDNVGVDNTNKREFASLKRLRDEAEKPQVNYYYSSSTSKLSRDERKLQDLVGTIERLEKRKSKTQRRSSLDLSVNPSLSNKDAPGDLLVVNESMADRENSSIGNAHLGDAGTTRGLLSKKRIIDDDDEDEERYKDKGIGDKPPTVGMTVQHGSVKRAKNATATDSISVSADGLVKKEYPQQTQEQQPKQLKPRQRGRLSVITIDGSGKASTNKNPVVWPSSDTLTSTVEIKSEPGFDQKTVVHQTPSSSTIKTKPAKSRAGGGRTIVEDPAVRIEHAEPRTQSSIAAQAIRYLPLYTIQLHSDPPTSKLDYFVVDLQIRLLLGMHVGTPRDNSNNCNEVDDDDDEGDDDARVAESNPLFAKYPNLCRQRVTASQKERLWEPLAGMFVSNLQFIHEATASSLTKVTPNGSERSSPHPPSRGSTKGSKSKGNSSRPKAVDSASKRAPSTADAGTPDADNELVSQFTLHEKRKFVALRLYFVKLDEVVRIIRRDFPQVSKQLITITLDLSSIGLADAPAVVSAHSPSTRPRPIANTAGKGDPESVAPVWNGPQKMLPLRYALKLYYRNKTRHQKPSPSDI
ncbi:hypothetical protein EV175_002847 [Coemansia sp. RSA 1933]|nr:hypothetical protein EV175_002847 [Coemansia sp. RSA 1933]